MCMSYSDGTYYCMVICACGKQNAAGECEHVKNNIIVVNPYIVQPANNPVPIYEYNPNNVVSTGPSIQLSY